MWFPSQASQGSLRPLCWPQDNQLSRVCLRRHQGGGHSAGWLFTSHIASEGLGLQASHDAGGSSPISPHSE
eukprot:5019516-Pyramimonas_sp.AAC.1